ncbi:MAG: hypothetical protein ABL959_14480 [Pyrinomonadaceae bacterium]
MINISTLKRLVCLTAAAAAIVLVGGSLSEANAQRDPFKKAGWAVPKKQPVASTTPKTPKVKAPVLPYAPPPVEARIEYYKRLRDAARENGTPIPKPTTVMTLSELAVTGIFKTSRGYAAMVEATPIKLSYPVYPGEKFFDGQLVAVEDNRLVFRKVTKVGEGKFVASVENKPLRAFSQKGAMEGTAQAPPPEAPAQTASNTGAPVTPGSPVKPASNPFLSPVDEMNNAPAEPVKEAPKKGTKKPAKVAKNNGK